MPLLRWIPQQIGQEYAAFLVCISKHFHCSQSGFKSVFVNRPFSTKQLRYNVRFQDDSMTILVSQRQSTRSLFDPDARARKSGCVLYNCTVSVCGEEKNTGKERCSCTEAMSMLCTFCQQLKHYNFHKFLPHGSHILLLSSQFEEIHVYR